jgi:hypothetical protein
MSCSLCGVLSCFIFQIYFLVILIKINRVVSTTWIRVFEINWSSIYILIGIYLYKLVVFRENDKHFEFMIGVFLAIFVLK